VNISIEFKGARGEPAGIPKLVLDFRAVNVWEYGVGIVSVKAEIRVAPSMNRVPRESGLFWVMAN